MASWSVARGPIELRSSKEGLRGLFFTVDAKSPDARLAEPTSSGPVEQLLLLAVPFELLLYVSLEPPWRFNEDASVDGHLKALCESSGMLQAKMKLALLLLWATGGPAGASTPPAHAQASTSPAQGQREESSLNLTRTQRMWRDYLFWLPTGDQQTTTVAFTSADVSELQDAELEAEVLANEAGVDKLWRVLADFAAGTPLGDALGDTPDNFRWALATVFERSLTVPFPALAQDEGTSSPSTGDQGPSRDQGAEPLMLVLAPFIDMANHSNALEEYGNAMLSYVPADDDVIRGLASLREPTGAVSLEPSIVSPGQCAGADPPGQDAGAGSLVTDASPIQPHLLLTYRESAAAPGREACICYLENAENRDLLRSFGFSLQNNPADQLTLLATSPAELAVLRKLFQVASIEEASAPDGTRATYASVYPNVAGPTATSNEDLPTGEREAAARLMAQCEAMLASFPTTLKEDEALLAAPAAPASKGGLSARARAATAFRAEKKRMLTQVQLILRLYT
eukprot:jgi/Mesvir1/19047/Mv12810-RA.1